MVLTESATSADLQDLTWSGISVNGQERARSFVPIGICYLLAAAILTTTKTQAPAVADTSAALQDQGVPPAPEFQALSSCRVALV
jgi:hypothetical protein